MNNEKFLNAYVEILTNTFHDALNKNIVFQAQAKITGEEIETYKQQITGLQEALDEYKDVQQSVEQKDHELLDKNAELGRLKNEFEQVKAETNHLNTFKNELISARQEVQNKQNEILELTSIKEKEKEKIKEQYEKKIEELNSKIEYLQMTPAQRRKVDAKNAIGTNKSDKAILVNEDSNDGGMF